MIPHLVLGQVEQPMPNVKREGGVLKPIPEKPKMYIAFEMSDNPTCDPNRAHADWDFKQSANFAGSAGSEDLLRTVLQDNISADPSKVYAIFEVVRLLKAETETKVTVIERNMR